MHAVVMESLEEYLSGTLEPAANQAIKAHLDGCQMCREEIQSMEDVSQLFVSLRVDEESLDASPGFYAGIVRQVGLRKTAPAFGNLFGMDLAFGRRLAFASLLTLAVLGTYLVSSEIEYNSGPSPEAIMAEQNSPNFESAPGQDNMLVTLTAYEQH